MVEMVGWGKLEIQVPSQTSFIACTMLTPVIIFEIESTHTSLSCHLKF